MTAEQASLDTESISKTRWYGYSGPTNIHTKNLQLSWNDNSYALPEYAYEDLPFLQVENFTGASIQGTDIIFSMSGSSGEKSYDVHFHFRNGKFYQRILVNGEQEDEIYVLSAKE